MLGPTEKEIRAFVGKKSGYYLSKWATLLAGEGQKDTFNISAFYFAGLWLPYRKMYKITLLFYVLLMFESLFEYILFEVILKYEKPPLIFSCIVGLAVGLVCGTYGNRWYYAHTCKNVLAVRRLGISGESHAQTLIKRGGTSWSAIIGFILTFMIAMPFVVGTASVLFEQG